MPEKIKAKISVAGFTYNGFFGDPILNNQRLVPILQPLYEALKTLNIRPQDVKYKNPAAANDASVIFELALGKIVLNLSHSGFTLTVNNADWNQADMVSQLIQSCWKAADEASGIKADRHELQIGMSFLPEGKSQTEITKQFADAWRLRPTDELAMCGTIIYAKNTTYVVDRAVANPQAIFVKIQHRFAGVTSFTEMLKQLYEDEMWLGDALGVEFE
jgi:hypothetical protein